MLFFDIKKESLIHRFLEDKKTKIISYKNILLLKFCTIPSQSNVGGVTQHAKCFSYRQKQMQK